MYFFFSDTTGTYWTRYLEIILELGGVEVDDVQMGGVELELEIGVEVDDVQMGGVELELEIILELNGVEADNVQMGDVELNDIDLADLPITEDTKLLFKGFEPPLSIVEMCKVLSEVNSCLHNESMVYTFTTTTIFTIRGYTR